MFRYTPRLDSPRRQFDPQEGTDCRTCAGGRYRILTTPKDVSELTFEEMICPSCGKAPKVTQVVKLTLGGAPERTFAW